MSKSTHCVIIVPNMKEKCFHYADDKNRELIAKRQISFDEVITAIDSGYLLDILSHPNQEQYPNQKLFIVAIIDYVYVVPYVEEKDHYFLKTIFPSRKLTKHYLGECDE